MQIKRTILTCCALIVVTLLFAQNNTSSPYTRYGLGLLETNTFGRGQAMGGSGFALRSNYTTNPSNPASFSAIDTLSQIFEFGFSGQISRFDTKTAHQYNNDVNFNYVAMAFPLSKHMGLSLGLKPFSNVGYNYYVEEDMENIGLSTSSYEGEGGISNAFIGISGKVFKNLSLGLNLNYYFGSIKHIRNASFDDASISSITSTENISVSSVQPIYGLQYLIPLNDKNSITLGGVYKQKTSLNAKQDIASYKGVYAGQRISYSLYEIEDNPVKFDVPESFGAGISYEIKNKLTATVEFENELWSKANYYNTTDTLADRLRISGGVEFIPNYIDRSYFKRVKYRMGGYYSNSYLAGLGEELYNFGMTFGFGLPLRYEKTNFNISFDIGQLKSSAGSLINETYGKVTINFSFNDYWFFRRKIE